MPYRFMSNKFNGKATIHVAAANSGDIIVVGNNSVSNLVVNATCTEVIAGAFIRKVSWGTDVNWSIKRGANVVMVLTGSGEMHLDAMAMNLDPTANISANTSSANSFLILHIDKIFAANGYTTVY